MKTIITSLLDKFVNDAIALGANPDTIVEALIEKSKTFAAATKTQDHSVINWIAVNCIVGPNHCSPPSVLYDCYVETGGTLSKQTFGRMLSSLGYRRALRTDGWNWIGLSLPDDIDAWVAGGCIVHPKATIAMQRMYADYRQWGGVLPKVRFNQRLIRCGYERVGSMWRGITTNVALAVKQQELHNEQDRNSRNG